MEITFEYTDTDKDTKRLFLGTNILPEAGRRRDALYTALSGFSLWSGVDKVTPEYVSWEFPKCVSEDILRKVVTKLGCQV